jgi:putative Holliday junction resolvase
MKILGLDLGSKTVGVALSDALGITAQGVETFVFPENHMNKALQHVIEIVNREKIKTIVLGYPKHMNGSIGERAIKTERFAEKLKEAVAVEVVLWDERMSTIMAQKILIDANVSRSKRKKVIDKMAAVVILQSYLDSK